MAGDKVSETLVQALRHALAEGAEQRLFKSGKLPGLFPSKTGASAEAAAAALRDGLLEVTGTETKGKTVIEWVRLTPRGVAFLHDHESPLVALRELRAALEASREGVPAWLEEMRQRLHAVEARLTEDTYKALRRLEALGERAEAAIRTLEEAARRVPEKLAVSLPWAERAVAYLDQRTRAGKPGPCPLPELFATLAEADTTLSVTAFHDGLRRLQEHRVLRLLPFAEGPERLPQPEYALLEGATLLYYAAR